MWKYFKPVLLLSGASFCLFASFAIWADNLSVPVGPVINQIIYQIRAEQWVTAKTANVIISISATLNEDQLAKAHGDILAKLNRLAKNAWHITQFDRTPNASGLEQLQVQAQARLPEEALSVIRSKAKNMSKPGETFNVDSITFEPELVDIELAKKELRDNIYQNINLELSKINKLYPVQHYIVHTLNFTENSSIQPMPGPRAMIALASSDANIGAESAGSVMTANKISLTANIVLASINK